MIYYKYPNTALELEPDGAYFTNEYDSYYRIVTKRHNDEWYIQQKICENKDGYFDFTKSMIDIGAYVGIYSWTLPFNFSHLFEPNIQQYFLCHANAVLHNKHQNVSIYNVAVGDNCGIIKYDGYNPGEHADPESSFDMKCITLDSISDKLSNIGFIKIDTEGFEYNVLRGAEQVIRNNNFPPILFELWSLETIQTKHLESNEQNAYHTHQISEFLHKLGYDILWGWGDEDTHLAIHKTSKHS